MTQGDFFPLDVDHHQAPRRAGADLKFEAVGADGLEYALKRQVDHPLLPASEWFCYHVAECCGLALPHWRILKDLDGTLAFGSRIEGGLMDLVGLPANELMQRIAACSGRMSACYAVDLFLGNEDRHFQNFLFRQTARGELAAMPIDYSRAWWVKGWPPQNVAGVPNNTTIHMEILRRTGLWKTPDAALALGALGSIKNDQIRRWLDEMPGDWLSGTLRDALIQWWGSTDFHARLDQCMRHS